jgi:hemoglobin
MKGRRVIGIAMAVALLAAGCATMEQKSVTAQKPLYDRLGGKPAIQAVVDDFVGNVAADGRINQRFAGADIPRLKALLVDQICQASGGPCQYTGRSMTAAHAGMKISDTEFDALVGDLVKSLDKFKVGPQEKRELLAALGGMKRDVVNQ